ncbi:hypothetical protein K439DRAFT_1536510 [Ramaria rubella]|nr:hypothetical protein K439DRAFT_1536510 [Ramaria rubella]
MADIGDAKHHKLDDLVNDDFRESEGHPEELSLEKAAILLSLIIQSCLFHYNNLNPPRVLNKELSDRTSCLTFLSHQEDTSPLKALQDAYRSGQYAPVRRLKTLNAPTTPPNATSPLPQGRSPNTTEDQLKDRIEQFFTTISSTMKCYVRGDRTLPKMERDAKHQDSTHIRDLEIPVLNGPSLLLHDLGRLSMNDAAATTRLSALFNSDSHILMCNASGSGKTRLILEVDSSGMGSSDLSQFMMDLDITPGWVRKLPSREDPAFNDAVSVNGAIAQRRLIRILYARLLIFLFFLQTAKEEAGEVTDTHKRLWLMLQISPTQLFSPHGDIFLTILYKILLEGTDTQIFGGINTTLNAISVIFDDSKKLFCVIDEAQVGANSHSEAFVSSNAKDVTRPILKEIVRVWRVCAQNLCFIVAGTSISIQVVNDAVASKIGKATFQQFHNTGAFDDSVSHENYIRRYIPANFLNGRGDGFMGGRYRFTAAFIRILVEDGWRSSHRLLDLYVHHYTGYHPTDGAKQLRELEPELRGSSVSNMNVMFGFERLKRNTGLMAQAQHIVFRYLTRKELVLGTDPELVEGGFARILNDSVRVDEPLILLTLARWLDEQDGFDFEQYIDFRLKDEASRWQAFEDAVTIYLYRAFQPEVPLTEIFNFFGDIPSWAHCGATLVTFTRDASTNLTWAPVDLSSEPRTLGCVMGCSSSNWEDVIKWLHDPEDIAVCLPDTMMGPDHLFLLRLTDGRLLFGAMQDKWHFSKEKLSKRELQDAIKSVTPSSYYSGLHSTTRSQVREELHAALSSLPQTVDVGGKFPILRVVAAWPSIALITEDETGDKHPLATLKMERVQAVSSTGSCMLHALGKQFEHFPAKRLEDEDETPKVGQKHYKEDDGKSSPSKRPKIQVHSLGRPTSLNIS